jgi:hypothetical protein
MSYSNLRQVKDVMVSDWMIEGEFHEDTQYYNFLYYVVVEDDAGERWVHHVIFQNDLNGAEALATKVKECGVINLKHWGFHEFFSLSLEERLNQEAAHEDMHRRGHGEYSTGIYSGGHA